MSSQAVDILTEDFESWPPSGWSINDLGGDGVLWVLESTTQPDGNMTGGTGDCADADSDNAGINLVWTTMTTPSMDVSTYGTVELEFKYDYYVKASQYGTVDISDDGGSTWTNVDSMFVSDRGPKTQILDITSEANGSSNMKVRWTMNDLQVQKDGWYQVDEVRIRAYPPLSITLRNAGDTADYTNWTLGSGKALDTVFIMNSSECVLVKNNSGPPEDFSISATSAPNWTLGSVTGLDTCVLMGLFNGDSSPVEGNFSTTNDLITGTTVWATSSGGSGKFEGTNDGDNVASGTGEKLYIYLKTPSSIGNGDQETITVTIGCRMH